MMTNKFQIKVQWMTEDGKVHTSKEDAETHQTLLRACYDIDYMPKAEHTENLIVALKALLEAGWIFQEPARTQEGQFPV